MGKALRCGRAVRSLLLLWCLGCAGCASLPQQAPPSDVDLAWVLAGAGTLPADGGGLEGLDSLMHVSDEMHRFAEEATRGRHGVVRKTAALVAALSEDDGLRLQYDASATLTAEQAFTQRRANCLSYTLLFAALARDVGVNVEFNDVEIPPVWDLGDARTSLLYRHLNLRIEVAPPIYQVVDVSGQDYDPSFEQQVIPDVQAEAQFYNNRAMELLLADQPADALRHELRALELSPKASFLWVNLANLYLRQDQLRAARIAVERGLALDRSSMLGYETAALVYRGLSQPRLAEAFHQRAQEFLDQNPYYHYQLALAALDRRDERTAYEETRRAIELRQQEPRFYFLLALLENRRGEAHLAEDNMQMVMELTRDPAQQERFRNKFARLKTQG